MGISKGLQLGLGVGGGPSGGQSSRLRRRLLKLEAGVPRHPVHKADELAHDGHESPFPGLGRRDPPQVILVAGPEDVVVADGRHGGHVERVAEVPASGVDVARVLVLRLSRDLASC